MDLGLEGRKVAVWGEGALAEHCIASFRAEGADVIGDGGELTQCDALVAIAPHGQSIPLDEIDDDHAFDAWDHVADLAGRCRVVTSGMTERRYGRVVWVGPMQAKRTGPDEALDLDGLVGLGALGLIKAMSGELGPDGITCNGILWDGDDINAAGAAVLFFASKASSYVTGVVVSVDGGASGSVF